MLRSLPSNVFLTKYYFPLILFGMTFVFWSVGFRWAQLIFLIPLFAGILFFLSLAVVQIPDGNIRYRRLFNWHPLPYDEIADCGVVWVIGYLRLKRFVFPWGRLYFVLDQNEKLFGRGEYPLVRCIREQTTR